MYIYIYITYIYIYTYIHTYTNTHLILLSYHIQFWHVCFGSSCLNYAWYHLHLAGSSDQILSHLKYLFSLNLYGVLPWFSATWPCCFVLFGIPIPQQIFPCCPPVSTSLTALRSSHLELTAHLDHSYLTWNPPNSHFELRTHAACTRLDCDRKDDVRWGGVDDIFFLLANNCDSIVKGHFKYFKSYTL